MEADLVKQLKIKSGIVRRIAREYESYEKEIKKDRERIAKLKDQGESDYTIKKQEEVLQETISMLPNTRKRLGEALEDARNFMKENDTNQELTSTEDWTQAEQHVATAQNLLAE